MNNDRKVKWGIIACGAHSTNVMIPAFLSCADSVLYAVASSSAFIPASSTATPSTSASASQAQSINSSSAPPNESNLATSPDTGLHAESPINSGSKRRRELEAACARHPHSIKQYASYSALLADSNIEAVYIATPNHLHAEWSIRALAAGKHVLCEKPLATTLEEVEQIAAAAQQHRQFYAEAFMYRFHPQYEMLRDVLQDDLLGTIEKIEISFHYQLDEYDNIRWRKECGGGALLDVGCYAFDFCHFVLQSAVQIDHAEMHLHPIQEVDEFTLVEGRLTDGPAEGATVSFSLSCNRPQHQQARMIARSAELVIERPFLIPRKAKPRLLLRSKRKEADSYTIPIAAANHFSLQLDGFSRRVLGEREVWPSWSDGVRTLEAIDAVRRAAAG